MAKSRVCEGDEGVTIIAGSGDFSATSGRERSSGQNVSISSPKYTLNSMLGGKDVPSGAGMSL